MQALVVGTPRHSPGPGLLSSKLTLLCAPALQASVGWQASPPPKPKAAGAKRKAPEELDRVKAEAEELGFQVGHGCRRCGVWHVVPSTLIQPPTARPGLKLSHIEVQEAVSFLSVCGLGCRLKYTYPCVIARLLRSRTRSGRGCATGFKVDRGCLLTSCSHQAALQPVVPEDPSAPRYKAS